MVLVLHTKLGISVCMGVKIFRFAAIEASIYSVSMVKFIAKA